jgi:uncharacterized protein YprB with RNaseH-like and TPR domain
MAAGRRRRSPCRKRISDETLAARLGGRVVRDRVILRRERLPVDAVHGAFPLVDSALHQGLSLCTGGDVATPRGCILMDTETTGLAGGTGTLVFLLGMARFSDGVLEIVQLFLTGFQGESAMLEEARGFLRGADTLVTFNGRSFDSPLLAARYRLSGLSDPFVELHHVDLLHVTRRTFKHRWPDCRLQTAERRLLGVQRIGDLPGSEAPRAWFEWVRHGRDDGLWAVCSHNRLDLLSLAVLPAALQRSHDDPIATGADVLGCARHYARGRGDEAAFAYLRRHRRCLDAEGKLELARLARRRGEWSLAVEIWEHLATSRVLVAFEHLAKYYEHQKRDFGRALQCTRRLLECAPHDHQHRQRHARLRRRLRR